MLKKFLKIFFAIILLFVIAGVVIGLIYNEKEPMGQEGPEAEALTEKMFLAVDKVAWDSTRYVQWNFMDVHRYLWDKERHLVQVSWGDHKVLLNPNEITGVVHSNGQLVSGAKADKLAQKAWSYFCNDSFWLNAVVKAKDPGTKRSIVTLKDGQKGLKVKYESGGVTPGDAYVWILDNQGRPTAWKMWTKIIPVGGLQFGWDEWKEQSSGAWLSTLHKGLFNLKISDVKTGQTLGELGIQDNPFN